MEVVHDNSLEILPRNVNTLNLVDNYEPLIFPYIYGPFVIGHIQQTANIASEIVSQCRWSLTTINIAKILSTRVVVTTQWTGCIPQK